MVSTFEEIFLCFDSDIFDSIIKIEFEGYSIPIFSKYHYYLSKQYGDYMKLPPETERVPKHDPIINLNKSFKDVKKGCL